MDAKAHSANARRSVIDLISRLEVDKGRDPGRCGNLLWFSSNQRQQKDTRRIDRQWKRRGEATSINARDRRQRRWRPARQRSIHIPLRSPRANKNAHRRYRCVHRARRARVVGEYRAVDTRTFAETRVRLPCAFPGLRIGCVAAATMQRDEKAMNSVSCLSASLHHSITSIDRFDAYVLRWNRRQFSRNDRPIAGSRPIDVQLRLCVAVVTTLTA